MVMLETREIGGDKSRVNGSSNNQELMAEVQMFTGANSAIRLNVTLTREKITLSPCNAQACR